jgi:antitoxin component YwqK of YwqJK toxin-antitoxin module
MTINRAVLAVAVVSTTLLVALLSLMLWAWLNEKDENPPRQVYSIDPECHPETSYSTGPVGAEGWVGWYHTCVQNHGPMFVWREGKLVERGHYVNGKRDGLFISYALDGSVIKKSQYVAGKEVPLEDG